MAVVLVTDGGPHPPAKWAQATAEHICPLDRSLTGERRTAAEKLQAAIALALLPQHENVQLQEKQNLATNDDHILSDHVVDDYVHDSILAIQQAAETTDWAAHYKRDDVIEAIKTEIASHFRTAQHIERLWHADRNPDNQKAQMYKAQFVSPEENATADSGNPLAVN